MTENQIPAMAFCLPEMIADEMTARGWTAVDVAERMSGKHGFYIRCLMMDLFLACGSRESFKEDQEFFGELAKALDVSKEYINNLHSAWRDAPVDRRQPFECPENLFSHLGTWGDPS